MTYLITGGTGLIGTYVIKLLVQDGARIIIYDINPVKNRILDSLLEKPGGSNIKIIRGDILDLSYLINIVQEYKVNRIIHLAALQEVYAGNPLIAITQINCIGTINILEAARILGVERVVWMSSQTVFNPGQKNIKDDTLHDPRSIYAATKSYSEQVGKYYFSEYKVDNIGIRPGTVYGAELNPIARGGSWSLTNELLVYPALGKPGKVTTGVSVDWMYVEDAARAVVMAGKAKTTKTRVFNVTGDFRSMEEAVNHVKKLIPDAKFTIIQRPVIPGEIRDSSGAKEEIGYEFQWKLEQGIEKTISDVRNAVKV